MGGVKEGREREEEGRAKGVWIMIARVFTNSVQEHSHVVPHAFKCHHLLLLFPFFFPPFAHLFQPGQANHSQARVERGVPEDVVLRVRPRHGIEQRKHDVQKRIKMEDRERRRSERRRACRRERRFTEEEEDVGERVRRNNLLSSLRLVFEEGEERRETRFDSLLRHTF